MKKNILYLLAVIALAGGYYYWSHGDDRAVAAADAEFGTLPGSSAPMAGGTEGQMTYSYLVTLAYPGTSALDFYGKKMTAKGWGPMDTNMFGDPNHWSSSPNVDPSTLKPSCEYKFVTVWASPKNDRITVLVLSYYDPADGGACKDTPGVDKLRVTLQEMAKP